MGGGGGGGGGAEGAGTVGDPRFTAGESFSFLFSSGDLSDRNLCS